MADVNAKKKIRLVSDVPFYNSVDLAICDFGGPEGKLRKRGKITVEYGVYDIKQLKNSGIESLEAAMDYYKDWIYRTVRRYILSEFELVADENGKGDWNEILGIIKSHIEDKF